MTSASIVHKSGIAGKDTRIAIVGTGVDYTHPVLGGGTLKTSGVPIGYDFVDDNYDGISRQPSDNLRDCSRHGAMLTIINIESIQDT